MKIKQRVILVISFLLTIFALITLYITFGQNSFALDNFIRTYHGIDVNKDCKIVIVEEHHEVIPFWLNATSKGKRVVLAHYDGHSDFGTPFHVEGRSIQEDIKSEDELITLMPSNDMFIVSFAYTKRLSKALILFPPWTPSFVEEFDLTPLLIGKIKSEYLEKYQVPDEEPSSRINCVCNGLECYIPLNETKTLPVECEKIINLPTAFLKLPLENVQQEDLSNSEFILDIDEDFFGVQLPISSLPDTLKNRTEELGRVQNLLGSVFCAERLSENSEVLANTWFRETFISGLLDCIARKNCEEARNRLKLNFVNHSPSLSCPHDPEFTRSAFDNMFNWFSNITSEDLIALKRIGICYQEPDLSLMGAFNEPRMSICLGRNLSPPNPSVIEYLENTNSPQSQQIEQDLFRILEEDIKNRFMRVQPSVITLARSARDGYTPRHRQMHIEKTILGILFKIYPNITQDNVCHSSHLFGGKKGWLAANGETYLQDF